MSTARDAEAGGPKVGDGVSEEAWRLRREIHATREEVDRYLEELGRRRRELTDVKLQARRHPFVIAGLGVAVTGAAVAAVLGARRGRKRKALSRVRRALGSLGTVGSLPRTAPNRRDGRLFGLFMDAGVPLGVALAKGLLRRSAGSASRPPR